ncbi:MAG: DNA repair protein RecN, partial [Desulfobacterales bacterium]
MLAELSIRDFAIIDDLIIPFEPGLTIMSGETGAGKSIIINAVNLLLGARASSDFIRAGADAAELAARFHIPEDSREAAIMRSQGMDPAEGLMIRRIIRRSSRHQIYINDRPATAALLTDLTAGLASISGQHAHQGLLEESCHLDLLDQVGGLLPLREETAAAFGELMPLLSRLRDLNRRQAHMEERRELLSFQKNEIQAAEISPEEDTRLEAELKRLKNAEELRRASGNAVRELYSADSAVTERVTALQKDLEKAARLDEALSSPAGALSDILFRLEDVVDFLRTYAARIETDERRMDRVSERLHELGLLRKKYGGDLPAVQEYLERITGELEEIGSLGERIRETEAEIRTVHGRLVDLARRLSRKRAAAAASMSRRVEKELADLNMAGTRFSVSLSPVPAPAGADLWVRDGEFLLQETGRDTARFLMAPNRGEDLKPLSRIASGGELSRVVLALKAMLAGIDGVGVVVFDEVDAGIGGAAAETVGRKIAALSRHHQVICITHLPQIARFADHHLRIEKSAFNGRTRTRIHPVTGDARVREIARMLSGETLTKATLAHASELLNIPCDTPHRKERKMPAPEFIIR